MRAERDHVDALGELERERRLLLDEQDAEAVPIELAERLQDLAGDLRGRDRARARRASAASAPAIRARPTASICCSPPESEPAIWSMRSFSRGNSVKTSSRRRSTGSPRAERVGAENEVLAHRHLAEQAAPLLHHDDAARARARASADAVMSSPLEQTLPVAGVSRVMARSSVVLPAPFGPEHGDELAFADGEAGRLQRLHPAIAGRRGRAPRGAAAGRCHRRRAPYFASELAVAGRRR